MNSKSILSSSISHTATQLEKICKNYFQPTLTITFSSPNIDENELVNLFNKHEIQIIGCSSAGEIHNEEYFENSIVILLIDPPKSDFKIFGEHYLDQQETQVAQQFAKEVTSIFADPAVLLFSSGIFRDGASIVNGIKKSLDSKVPIYGGLAGDGVTFEKTTCYNNKHVSTDGFVAVVFDNTKIRLEGKAVSGWSGIGKKSIATKAKGNVLYEIDDKPALDVFQKYSNLMQYRSTNDIDEITAIPGQYPLEIIAGNSHKLRSILQFNEEDRSMLLAGTVDEGDVFKFCNSPTFEQIENTINAYSDFASETSKIDALVLVSCKARHLAFGPLFEDEIKGIKEKWEAPLIGFLSYGEIGKTKNAEDCDFHNATNALITIQQVSS